ncbi:MAG TPA: crosslink repair DNA glycosylase YcaQ family protein [Ktedonobacteraceae bacterium]
MTLDISREQARRFLALYHFTPTDVAGTMERLATVQYDPLNPVKPNPDLVLQARVPGYQVDDWQKAAYSDRLIYDAWDKQASLITVKDGHTIFWRSEIDKRVSSTEQALGIIQDTTGRTALDWLPYSIVIVWRTEGATPASTRTLLACR